MIKGKISSIESDKYGTGKKLIISSEVDVVSIFSLSYDITFL